MLCLYNSHQSLPSLDVRKYNCLRVVLKYTVQNTTLINTLCRVRVLRAYRSISYCKPLELILRTFVTMLVQIVFNLKIILIFSLTTFGFSNQRVCFKVALIEFYSKSSKSQTISSLNGGNRRPFFTISNIKLTMVAMCILQLLYFLGFQRPEEPEDNAKRFRNNIFYYFSFQIL